MIKFLTFHLKLANLRQFICQKILIVGIYKDAYQYINIKNQVHNHSDDLIKPEKIETKNILIDKNFKDVAIYFTRYVKYLPIKILSLYFHKLMGKIEQHQVKNI